MSLGINITIQQGSLALIGNDGIKSASYDFAYGNYLYSKGFFAEMNRIQNELVNGTGVTVGDDTWTLDKPGDLLALQSYMSSLEAAKEGVVGLGRKGLKVEYSTLTGLADTLK